MPVPKPSKIENHQQFMRRCMGDSKMKSEYPHNQRVAICLSQWGATPLREVGKKKK